MAETPNSGASTPNDSRFMSQAVTVEDRLKADTVGLVTLDDFRKRRAEALEAADGSTTASGATTPDGRELGASAGNRSAFKKRKKVAKKGGLSFGDGEDDVDAASRVATPGDSRAPTPSTAPDATDSEAPSEGASTPFKKKSLRPNTGVGMQPKALTKSALLKEAQLKEQLRREYMQIQEAVKATEFMIPFVFYDGKNIPGGMVRMKKGDHIWLFLERARKVGADLAGKGDKSRRDWARISVDDLMVVKGDLIIPHHQDFHYFIINKTVGYVNGQLFNYSAEPTSSTPKHLLPSSNPASNAATPEPPQEEPEGGLYLQTAAQRKQQAAQKSDIPDADLEGYDHDPNLTKVVDRRWYERNKHIYPASSWEEFDATRDYASGVKKDRDGNAMFFSR